MLVLCWSSQVYPIRVRAEGWSDRTQYISHVSVSPREVQSAVISTVFVFSRNSSRIFWGLKNIVIRNRQGPTVDPSQKADWPSCCELNIYQGEKHSEKIKWSAGNSTGWGIYQRKHRQRKEIRNYRGRRRRRRRGWNTTILSIFFQSACQLSPPEDWRLYPHCSVQPCNPQEASQL